jgi:hypothetical protein
MTDRISQGELFSTLLVDGKPIGVIDWSDLEDPADFPGEYIDVTPPLTPGPMVHRTDYATSVAAAEAVRPHVSPLMWTVHAELARLGDATDAELERLAVFDNYAPSTVRKRRTDLYQLGMVEPTGETRQAPGRRCALTVWRVVEGAGPSRPKARG